MATITKESQTNAKPNKTPGVVQAAEKDVKPLQAFFTKFNNDWCMNFSGALAYSLLMSMFPIAIAILSIFGFFLSSLDPQGKAQMMQNIQHILPSQVSGTVLDQVNTQLQKTAGLLGIIAVILALFNGSRLFIQIEGFFSIIYHVRQRPFIPQNIMAFGMLLIFVVLVPIMTFAAAAPSLVLTPVANVLPGRGILLTLTGILGGLIAAFLLFLAIYVIVPNQHISFRNSLPGSVVAAIALQLYLVLFPLYVSHFLGSFATGPISLIILLVFFYYFAVILLLGAEVNAFFAEKVQATPTDLPTLVHIVTSHLPKKKEDKEVQAAASHKDEQTGSAAKKADGKSQTHDVSDEQLEAITTAAIQGFQDQGHHAQKVPAPAHQVKQEKHQEHKTKMEKPKQATSKVETMLEAIAGTALAFVVELVRIRRRKPQ